MIIRHQTNVSGFAGGHTYWWLPQQILRGAIAIRVVTISDPRVVAHLVTIPVPDGDAIRMRAVRTDGSDELLTIDEGSSLNVKVLR